MSFSTHGGSAEDLEERHYPFPTLTAYVTIKLDPLKSVELLEDEEATAVALSTVSKVYVGYVANDGDWDDDDDEENDSYKIHLLRSGLPPSSPDEYIDKYMCTPVFPNTDHPTRQPLKPSKPLPDTWQSCYLASFETVTLRVPVSRANDDLAVTMPWDARIGHGTAIMDDQKRQRELSNVYPLRASGSSGEDNGHADATSRHSVSSRARTVSIASVPVESKPKPVPPPIANLSYDITSVPTLEDPQDLLAEIKFIMNLYKEARTRTLARTARAIAAAKELDDAAFGRPSTLGPALQTAADTPLQEEPI